MNRAAFKMIAIGSLTFFQLPVASRPLMAQDLTSDPSTLPPIVCPAESSAEMFSLIPLKYPLPPSEVVGKLMPGVTGITPAKDSIALRLDVCWDMNTSDVTLMRILYRSNEYGEVEVYSGANIKSLKVENLNDLAFGRPDRFSLLVRSQEDRGILVRGQGNAPENRFVAAVGVEFPSSSDAYRLIESRALLGIVEVGDAFSGGPCEIGTSFFQSQVNLGSARLLFDLCTFLGGGETTGYTIKKIVVVDKNPLVPAATRGSEQVFEGAALEGALRYKFNHHNACDSFVLSVPALESVYAATSAPAAGCGTSIEGAPERTWDEVGPSAHKAFFRIDYQSKFGEIKTLERPHYLKFYEEGLVGF
jgi:hypothetical protein